MDKDKSHKKSLGKGGQVKRIVQSFNLRVCRAVTLGIPTERYKTQLHFHYYILLLPASGLLVFLFLGVIFLLSGTAEVPFLYSLF